MRANYPEGLKMALFVHYMFNIFIHVIRVIYFVYILKYQNKYLKIIFG